IDLEFRAVHDRVALLLTAFLIYDREHTVTVHRNEETFLIPNGLQLMKLDRAGILRFQARLFGHAACRSTDVERTHCELRSGFADRLRRNDTYRFADLDEFSSREI